MFEYHLHPEIVAELLAPFEVDEDTLSAVSGLQIADVGTGTAIWLLELSEKLPNATLVGLDNSAAQFPAKNNLPRNVQLVTWDVNTEPPSELCGQFDVVHLRNLLMLVDKDDPSRILENCAKLLGMSPLGSPVNQAY